MRFVAALLAVLLCSSAWSAPLIASKGISTTNISATGLIQANNVSSTGGVSVTGNVSANKFIGDGSSLTGISGAGGSSAALGGFSGLVLRTDQISASDTVTATFNVAVLVNASGQVTRTTTGSYAAKIGVVGIGGLDAVTTSATTQWLYPYVVSGVSGTGLVLSSNNQSPTLSGKLTGYTYWARAGAVITDGSSNKYFLKTLQRGNRAQFVVEPSTNTPKMPIMAAGSSGAPTTPTYASVDTTNYFPPTAYEVCVVGFGQPTYIFATNTNYGAAASTSNSPMAGNAATTFAHGPLCVVEETANTLYWACNNSNCFMDASGWRDNL